MINSILENKKIIIIIFLVLAAGAVLQLSRSSLILNFITNKDTVVHSESLLLTPSEMKSEVATNPEYCIVYNADSIKLKDNVKAVLQYMQKDFKTFDTGAGKITYSACPNILLTTTSLSDLGSVDEIENFTKNGGYVYSLTTLEIDLTFNILSRDLGILFFNGYSHLTGLEFQSDILLNSASETFLEDALDDYGLNIDLENQITSYITSTSGNPILWEKAFGEGKFIVFNANILAEKISRGLITGLLSITQENFIYPIFNAKTFFIDDFPAPIAKGTNETIYKEYQMDLSKFYKTIWWPNMLEVSKKYDFVYTGAIIETYTDNVDPPFENKRDDDFSYLISFGRELIHSGGELGFHGYNHQAFTLDKSLADSFGYRVWNSIEDMKASLEQVVAYTKRGFPSYIVSSYVPPSNVLSKEGRAILKSAIPDLKVISSLYAEDGTNRSYIQEFKVADDQVVEMPRISSGYFSSSTTEWEIANAVTTHGFFSHFIHPDDVISEDRSKGGWEDTLKDFNQLLSDVEKRYGWLRPLTATNAAYSVASTLQAKINIQQSEEAISGVIENYTQPQYFILRTKQKIKTLTHCSLEKIGVNTYLVLANDSNFSIELKRSS